MSSSRHAQRFHSVLLAETALVLASAAMPAHAQTAAQIQAIAMAQQGAAGGAASTPGSGEPAVGNQQSGPGSSSLPSIAILQPYRMANQQNGNAEDGSSQPVLVKKPPERGEFELFAEQFVGHKLRRYGTDLVLPALRDFAAPATATIPPDYIVQPGDTLAIAMAGSVEGSVTRVVDTNGKIYLSGVGAVKVAGVRNSDLRDIIASAMQTQFRGFSVSVNVTRLRGIRVYVTGLANNPGAFTVSSLSTLANAVFQAGGPNSGGSWRTIKLYRNGQEVTDFDLYQLMRGGSRVNDVQLQNEDVLFIPPAGKQIAVFGSVQEEAIYEAKPGESVSDILAAAGGPNTVGDRSRVILYRRGGTGVPGPRQLDMDQSRNFAVAGGDMIQVLSAGTLIQPLDQQSVVVRVEGEVSHPGNYYLPPDTSMSEVIAKAGGLTASAFPFGTHFTRQSVRNQQQEGYLEAIHQLEISIAAAPLTSSASFSDSQRSAQILGSKAVLDRLREVQPDGRVVLQIAPSAKSLPGAILLENNDRIYVPRRPNTVGVFGAVYRPASFFLDGSGLKVRDYIEKAGGALRSADRGNTFVVRANGEIISAHRGAIGVRLLPGDVVFVPVQDSVRNLLDEIQGLYADPVSNWPNCGRRCVGDQVTPPVSIIGYLRDLRPMRQFRGRLLVFGPLLLAMALLACFPQRYLAATSLTPSDPESLGISGTLGQLGAINSVLGNQAAVEVALRVGKSVSVRDEVIAKTNMARRLNESDRITLHRWLEKRVTIRSLRGGIVTIELTLRDEVLASDIVRAYSVALRDRLAQISRSQTSYKRDVLLKLVTDANDRLAIAQRAYDNFRRNARYADPRSSIEAIGMRVPVLENAIKAKQVELMAARQLYTDQNVVVRQLNAEIASLSSQLAQAKTTDPANGESVGTLIDQTGQLFKLERELGLSKALYDSYLRYLQGTAVEDLTSTANVRIIEPAYIDTERQFYMPAVAAAVALFILWGAIEFYSLRPPVGAGTRRTEQTNG